MNNAFSINNSNEIAGSYLDSASITHGFFRDASGALTFPIDFPGASSTFPFGINDQGIIIGRYTDRGEPTMGSFRMPNSVCLLRLSRCHLHVSEWNQQSGTGLRSLR